MNDNDKALLLDVARKSIMSHLYKEEHFSMPKQSDPNAHLWEKKGCFVTLTSNSQLRGCIGTIEPIYPLIKGVHLNALNAAFYDPRFSPLSVEEYPAIRIEISVLTEPAELHYTTPHDLLNKVKPGVDGIILQLDHHQATFLPQVWEELSNPEDFFNQLSWKAGLTPNDWKNNPNMKIFTYQVEKFAEE